MTAPSPGRSKGFAGEAAMGNLRGWEQEKSHKVGQQTARRAMKIFQYPCGRKNMNSVIGRGGGLEGRIDVVQPGERHAGAVI